MKIVIAGGSTGGGTSRQYVSSYVINDTVAIDAGCLGLYRAPETQAMVRHVLLTHAHADHIASLPFFLENVWTPAGDCPILYGSPETLDTVQRHLFNDEVWPDLSALSQRMPPFLRIEVVRSEVPIQVQGLTITPVAVNHTVPTLGYVVQEGRAAVIFAGDSGPTERLWQIAQGIEGLQAVFLEASFPNHMKRIAEASCHLTPEMFASEAANVPAGVCIIAVHLKVRYRDEIVQELSAAGLPALEIGECDREYLFC